MNSTKTISIENQNRNQSLFCKFYLRTLYLLNINNRTVNISLILLGVLSVNSNKFINISKVVEHLPFKQRVGGSRPPALTESRD